VVTCCEEDQVFALGVAHARELEVGDEEMAHESVGRDDEVRGMSTASCLMIFSRVLGSMIVFMGADRGAEELLPSGYTS
jgi:hypothetical protein